MVDIKELEQEIDKLLEEDPISPEDVTVTPIIEEIFDISSKFGNIRTNTNGLIIFNEELSKRYNNTNLTNL